MRSARPENVGEKGASHKIWADCRGVRGPSAPGTGKLFSRDRNRPKPLESKGLRLAR